MINRVAIRWIEASDRDAWLDHVFDGTFDSNSKFAGKMDFQAVFMMGPPGAGKSYVKARKFLKYTGFHDIDSDEMKKRHPDYDPNHPEMVHAWSSAEQKREFYRVLPTGEPFVYDGTGWDPKPTLDRVHEAREAGYRIFLVYVYVPLEISLFRNRNRDRFVPEEVLMDKAPKVDHAFGVIRQQVDKYKVILNYDSAQLAEAKRDMEMYPPPQAPRPPRPGDPDYGQVTKQGSSPATYTARLNNLNDQFLMDCSEELVNKLRHIRDIEDLHLSGPEITGYHEDTGGRFRVVLNPPMNGRMAIEMHWGGGVGGDPYAPKSDVSKSLKVRLDVLGENPMGVAFTIIQKYLPFG